jgi:hypothetical protein
MEISTGTKKTKIIIIIGVVFLVLVAAFLTVMNSTLRIGVNSSTLQSGAPTEISPMGVPAPAGMGGGFTGAVREKSLMMDNSAGSSADSGQAAVPATQDKRVIKNGDLTMKVNSVDGSVEEIGQIAKDNGGDVFSSNFYKNTKNLKTGTLIVKVPVANFEKVYAEIKKVAAVVVRESTSGQDVTEEYQDIESQIKNKQAEEEAYKKILDRAVKVSDILEVTQALTQVRGEIESLQGRLKYLASQTDMAMISIQMSEDSEITVSESWRPIQIAKDAINSLIRKTQGFVNFLIVLVITVIPVAILYLLLVWILYRIGKSIWLKFKRKKENSPV